jgi:hypothetical protein
MTYTGSTGEGVFNYEGYIACDESGLFGYSVRILPCHKDMTDSFGLEKMLWISEKAERTVEQQLCEHAETV